MAGKGNDGNFSNPYGPRKTPQTTSSLLLSPPGNNFLFQNLEDSALLVPVLQDFRSEDLDRDDEAGQFLGGNTAVRPSSEPPTLTPGNFQSDNQSLSRGYSQSGPYIGGSGNVPPPSSFGSVGNLGTSSAAQMFPPTGGQQPPPPPRGWAGPPSTSSAPFSSSSTNTPLRPRYVSAFAATGPSMAPATATSALGTYGPNAPGQIAGAAGFPPYPPTSTGFQSRGMENANVPSVPPSLPSFGAAPASQQPRQPSPPTPTDPRYPFTPPHVNQFAPPACLSVPATPSSPGTPPYVPVYQPVQPHWFYCKMVEKRQRWFPFSLLDSVHLEEENQKLSSHPNPNSVLVSVEGGRYDVHLQDRLRSAVYWEEKQQAVVRRATWFFRVEGDRKFLPYPEHFSDKLESEYCVAVTTNTWNRRLEFPDNESVIIHNPNVIVHYQPSEWDGTTGLPESQAKPRVVKRGMDETENVEDGEAIQIDHLVFVVHGIGAICDLKFRTIREVVDDFRSISNQLVGTHFKKHRDENRIGRVEFLPVSWHTFLHGDATGIDEKLKPITLKSIPKLRYFANDAILDVLFYTSPVFCQTIITQVSSELNRLHALFLSRNPSFTGQVSLAGHSLGSTILFDLLVHQADSSQSVNTPTVRETVQQADSNSPSPASSKDNTPLPTAESENNATGAPEAVTADTIESLVQQLGLEEYLDLFQQEKMDMDSLVMCSEGDLKEMGIPLGPRKKLMDFFKKRQMKLDEKEARDFLTEMHQQQPSPSPQSANPALRRRKQSETTINYIVGLAGTGHPYVSYPRLSFQPTCFFALGSPIAMFLTVRGADVNWEDFRLPTCPGFFNIFHPFDPVAYRIEPLVDPNFTIKPVLIPHHKGRKRMHLEIKESLGRVGADLRQKLVESLKTTWNTLHDFAVAHRKSTAQLEAEVDKVVEEQLKSSGHQSLDDDDDAHSTMSGQDFREEDIMIGQLNGGRRIDYVLQEKPIESFNEYLFALGSHTCYWESEDTVLLLLKEIYCSYGIQPSFQGAEPPPKPHPVHYQQFNAPPPSSSFSNQQHMQPQQQTGASSWFRTPPTSHAVAPTPRNFAPPPPSGPGISTSSPYLPFPNTGPGNQQSSQVFGMDPTQPIMTAATAAPPPPRTGFVKQSITKK